MNPTARATIGAAHLHAAPPAPGTNAIHPDVLFICGDDLKPHQEDRKDYLQRASDAYGVASEFITLETSDGKTVFDMLDDLHARNRIRPSTAIVIIMHGTRENGHHMMQFSRDQPLVSTMALLERIARLDGGDDAASSQRSCVLHSCSVNVITQDVKKMSGNYFLIGGKDINLLEPAMDAITELLRQTGCAKKEPRESETGRLTAEQTFGCLAAAVGTTVSHAGNGQLAQSRARTHADFKNPAIKSFGPNKEKRAADAILHLLCKKKEDKLKSLLDEVPAARAALKSPDRDWMHTALAMGTARQIRLLMSHGVPTPAPAAFLQHLAALGIGNKDDDVSFILDEMIRKPETSPLISCRLRPEIRVQWLGEAIAKDVIAHSAPAGGYESDLALLGIICGRYANFHTSGENAFRLLVDHACQWLQERAAAWGVPGSATGLRKACFNSLAARLPGPFGQALMACRARLLAQGENESAVLAVTGSILAAEALRSSREAEMRNGYDPKNKPEHQAGHWFTLADHASRLASMLQAVHAASPLQGNGQ